jgi:hypothetical protein
MQLKQTWDMTSLQLYLRIKNGDVARIMFGAFHAFLMLDVVLQPSVKRKCVTGRRTLVGKLVTGHTAAGSNSEALA